MIDYQMILNFWFGVDPDDLAVIKRQGSLWFGKDEMVDRQIKQQFEPMIAAAPQNLKLPVRDSLAVVILLDQFTRNIYRGTAQAFAFDRFALQLALDGLGQGADRLLRPVERVFFYLPLEHSERLENQNRAVECYQALTDEVPEKWQKVFDGFLDYAIRHQVIIERFGRFPHRNAMLGRSATAEELEFLKQPGSSF